MQEEVYYVVWIGRQPGVYDTWEGCNRQVKGVSNALFKKFNSRTIAEQALRSNPEQFFSRKHIERTYGNEPRQFELSRPIEPSIAVSSYYERVDETIEYEGLDLSTEKRLFHFGPIRGGSAIIAEYLALINGLACLDTLGPKWSIYSNSEKAIQWLKYGQLIQKVPPFRQYASLLEQVRWANHYIMHQLIFKEVSRWLPGDWGDIPSRLRKEPYSFDDFGLPI